MSSATINTYRCALKEPLREASGIDLNSDIFGAIGKSFALARPAERTPLLSWSLDAILAFFGFQAEFTVHTERVPSKVPLPSNSGHGGSS